MSTQPAVTPLPTTRRAWRRVGSGYLPEPADREREILSLIAGHRTNPEIAQRLQLSEKTVGNHISNIFTKLQVADRAQAIIRAREVGLGAEEGLRSSRDFCPRNCS